MKIGIIDSGVDPLFVAQHDVSITSASSFLYHPDEGVVEGIEYDQKDIERGDFPQLSDEHGHGTAVLSILWKRFKGAEFVVSKMLDAENKGYSICLVSALEWMIEKEPDVINMSLGVSDLRLKEELFQLTLLAKSKGIKIFAAASACLTIPAGFGSVITVGDTGLREGFVDPTMMENIDLFETQKDVEVWWKGEWIKRRMSTSFACALNVSV